MAASTPNHIERWVDLNVPSSTRNSPMKPLVPGTAMLEKVMIRNSAANTGMLRATPPYSMIARVCRRS